MKDFEPKWKFVKNLGEGGQAHTYLVESGDSAGSMGAAKRLKNEKREPRFNDEIDALRRLDHPCSTITPRSSDDLETILGKRANQQRGENALGADTFREFLEGGALKDTARIGFRFNQQGQRDIAVALMMVV